MTKPFQIKRSLSVILLLLIAVVFLITNSLISAQNQDDPASGLQISPTRTEVTVKAGSTETISVTLKNVTGGNIIAKPEINDFESDNNTGTPRLITDNNQKSVFTIKDFVGSIPDTPMSSGESKNIKVPLSVPKDQPPGGYFGVIRFIAEPISNNAENEGRQVTLTASIGHIVLVNVPGNVKEQLQLISLDAEKDGKAGSVFSSAPTSVALGLKNEGNSFSKPFGTIVIKDFKGKEIYRYEINNTDPRGNVLPGSTRVFHDQLQNVEGGLGKYKISASVSYGTGGDVLVSETTFWVIPMWFRIAVGLLLLILIALIIFTIRRFRGHEKRYKVRR